MPAYLQHKGQTVRDVDWVANMFAVAPEAIQKKYQFAAWSTTAHNKFTDTRIGGNWAINNPPAYTRYADPKQSGVNNINKKGTVAGGMGAFYSEQLDDNAHLIHMCFGVPSFKGMISFFSGMGSIEAAMYARLGRVSFAFLVGKAVGVYTAMRFLPLLLVGMAGKFLLNRGSSKYYNLKPTMHSYWKRVDFICNSFAVSMGLYQPPAYLDWGKKDQEAAMDPTGTSRAGYTESEHSQLVNQAYQMAPEIFRKRGGIDVYAMANRAQALALRRRQILEKYADGISSKEDIMSKMIEMEYKMDLSGAKPKSLEELLKVHEFKTDGNVGLANDDFHEDQFSDTANDQLIKDSIANDEQAIGTANQQDQTTSTTNADGTVTANAERKSEALTDPNNSAFGHMVTDPQGNKTMAQGWMSKIWDSLTNNYHGSYEWVSFRVEGTSSISSSFSNSSKEAEITSMINGFSSSMASARFTFSNGATGLPVFDTAIKAVKDTLLGFAAGMDVAGVISLAGSAYVDIPEHWESSSSTFPSESFKMQLRTVYANKLSRFMSMYVPLSMIIAGSLPISTGRQQYTSPYMCQVISPGRMSCKLGMVENLSIDIGTGNIGYNQQNQPLGFDVSWTVKDMNKTMHAPIDTGASLLNPLRSVFDDDNAFNDYLNVLAAVSMADQINPVRKLSKNIALRLNQWDSFWSVGNMTMGFFDSSVGRGVKSAITLAGLAGVPGTAIPQLNRSLAQ